MTYYFNGHEFFDSWNIGKVIIYGNGKKYFETNRRIEPKQIKKNERSENKVTEMYGDTPDIVYLSGDIKNARKENLNRKDNYYISYYEYRIKHYALYIHVSEIPVEDCGDVLAFETEEERQFLHTVKLTFKHARIEEKHAEKIPVPGTWKLPEGARWSNCYGTEENPCYDTYDNKNNPFAIRHGADPEESGVIKRWITYKNAENVEIYTTFPYYTKTEYSPERIRKMKIADAINNSGEFRNREFSHYDITKLEKVLNISLK